MHLNYVSNTSIFVLTYADPFVEKALGQEGKQKVKQSLEEHTAVEEEAMKAIEMRKTGGKELATTMKQMLDDFTEHLLKEENDIMVKVVSEASHADLSDLAMQFQQAKESAPLDPQVMA